MSDKDVVLVGYSGHAYVVADAALIASVNLKYYSEKKENLLNPFNLKYLGREAEDSFFGWSNDVEFILGIGDNRTRQIIAKMIAERKKLILNVIHPNASISKTVKIGIGNFVSRNVSINPFVDIGNYCILNTACVIEHECVIGEAAHIAPGAVLAGNVSVGERSFIGANATIKQGVKIGKDVIIGAGTVIIKDVANGKKIVGNPAREL